MFNICPKCGKLFILKSSYINHSNKIHDIVLDDSPKDIRGSRWLLLPILAGVIGSIMLYYLLKEDVKNGKEVDFVIRKSNGIIGIISILWYIYDFYYWLDLEFFAFINDCIIITDGMIC